MGIPQFSRWLIQRYPAILALCSDTQPDADNLYVDLNNVVHLVTHAGRRDEKLLKQITVEDAISATTAALQRMVQLVRPQKRIVIAVDGVAPVAKMKEQRSRRFRKAAVGADDPRAPATCSLLKGEESQDEKHAPAFDTCKISPGTEFMEALSTGLKGYFELQARTDPLWQGREIIYSCHKSPGEGEHKIAQYLRDHRDEFDPNEVHYMYGLDADLVMLCLASKEPYFVLFRETELSNTDSHVRYTYLHLNVLRQCLQLELCGSSSEKLSRVLDDFVLLCMIIGNDFLPCLPNIAVSDHLPGVFETYREKCVQKGQYLCDGTNINFKNLAMLLEPLAEKEIASILASKDLCRRTALGDLKKESKPPTDADVRAMFYKKWGVPTTCTGRDIARSYIEGLMWTMKYYYVGCPSWTWCFPYHCAPFVSDLLEAFKNTDINGFNQKIDEDGPLTVVEQLLYICPPVSARLLPAPFRSLLISESSPLNEYIPDSVTVQGYHRALIPHIPIPVLRKSYMTTLDALACSDDIRKLVKTKSTRMLVFDGTTASWVKLAIKKANTPTPPQILAAIKTKRELQEDPFNAPENVRSLLPYNWDGAEQKQKPFDVLAWEIKKQSKGRRTSETFVVKLANSSHPNNNNNNLTPGTRVVAGYGDLVEGVVTSVEEGGADGVFSGLNVSKATGAIVSIAPDLGTTATVQSDGTVNVSTLTSKTCQLQFPACLVSTEKRRTSRQSLTTSSSYDTEMLMRTLIGREVLLTTPMNGVYGRAGKIKRLLANGHVQVAVDMAPRAEPLSALARQYVPLTKVASNLGISSAALLCLLHRLPYTTSKKNDNNPKNNNAKEAETGGASSSPPPTTYQLGLNLLNLNTAVGSDACVVASDANLPAVMPMYALSTAKAYRYLKDRTFDSVQLRHPHVEDMVSVIKELHAPLIAFLEAHADAIQEKYFLLNDELMQQQQLNLSEITSLMTLHNFALSRSREYALSKSNVEGLEKELVRIASAASSADENDSSNNTTQRIVSVPMKEVHFPALPIRSTTPTTSTLASLWWPTNRIWRRVCLWDRAAFAWPHGQIPLGARGTVVGFSAFRNQEVTLVMDDELSGCVRMPEIGLLTFRALRTPIKSLLRLPVGLLKK
eukprot:PhM_4_TR3631/c0_g1_i1/m.27726/K12618/XRN1, SEP1, KEM1; 5'-3' exoribonuclease 1